MSINFNEPKKEPPLPIRNCPRTTFQTGTGGSVTVEAPAAEETEAAPAVEDTDTVKGPDTKEGKKHAR